MMEPPLVFYECKIWITHPNNSEVRFPKGVIFDLLYKGYLALRAISFLINIAGVAVVVAKMLAVIYCATFTGFILHFFSFV